MKTLPSVPELRPTGLEHLLAALRAAGLPVGAHEILRLHHIFALAPGLGQDRPPGQQLRDLLASALTHDTAERRLFDDIYEPWAKRWAGWARRRSNGSAATREPDLGRFQALAPTHRRRRRHSWAAVMHLAAVGILAALLSRPSGYNEAEKRAHIDPLIPGVETVHRVWLSPLALAMTSIWRPDWQPLGLGVLALAAAGMLTRRYRQKSWLPEVLSDPLPGPARLPLLPLSVAGPELLDASGAETLIWGVDRHITERLTAELDLEATARETARAGGIPELRFEPEKRLREVWLWLDGTVEDPALERWAEEIARSLERSGLPVRIGGFDGVPNELAWDEGQSLRPIEVEAHRETALVAVCTDGEVLLRQLQDERGAALRPLLSSLAAWQRLAVVDFSRRGDALSQALGPLGQTVVSPEELPAFFGLGATRPSEPVEVDPGEVRAWRAALALGGRPIDRPTAFAARRALGLDLSPWTFHLLAEGERDDPARPRRLGERLIWSTEGRTTLVAWLAEGSLADPSGIRKGSLLERALDFWQTRLASEADRRGERAAVEPWTERPAERHLRMERDLLRLWREPRQAAEELFELGTGDLREELSGRLGQLAPRDGYRPGSGLTPLPWRLADLDDRSRYLLAERGLGGVRRGALASSGRLGLGLGVLGGLAWLLLVAGIQGRKEQTSTTSGFEVVEAQTAPQDGRQWVKGTFVELDGGTFRMGSEADDQAAYRDEQPAHDVTVGEFRIGQTEVTNVQYRGFKPDHPGEDDLPAVNVSWFEARDYCRSLGSSQDWEYDLPTEAEWEFAARAGTTSAWSFGDNEEDLGNYAWFAENSTHKAQEVGEKEPNPWGLHDVHGNVWEWVLDCGEDYADRADPNQATIDPGSGADSCHQSDTPGARRVLRGGAFNDEPRDLRSAFRGGLDPGLSGVSIGFRCVRRARRQP